MCTYIIHHLQPLPLPLCFPLPHHNANRDCKLINQFHIHTCIGVSMPEVVSYNNYIVYCNVYMIVCSLKSIRIPSFILLVVVVSYTPSYIPIIMYEVVYCCFTRTTMFVDMLVSSEL